MLLDVTYKRAASVVFCALALAFCAQAQAATPWGLSGWQYRKQITISPSLVGPALADFPLTNFPLYVRISGDASIGANALSTGYDIRFTSSDGTTGLAYQRERFSITSGYASGDFWVQVPVVSPSNTTIYIYYGNSAAADGRARRARGMPTTWPYGILTRPARTRRSPTRPPTLTTARPTLPGRQYPEKSGAR
jgi:hypothetical protein